MTDTRCGVTGCGRPAHDSTICAQHTWELQRRLGEVPALLADLDISLSRQGKVGPTTERVGGKGETPVSFNPGASKAQTELRSALIRWAVATGMPWAAYATTAAAHLLVGLPTLRTSADLPSLFTDVNDAYWAATRAVDAPANRTIIPVGPCPEEDEDGQSCAGQVQAFIPADDRPARMACTLGEGHYWPSIQWLRTGKRIREAAARHGWAARALTALTPAAVAAAMELQAAEDRLRMVTPDGWWAEALADVRQRAAVATGRGAREPMQRALRDVYREMIDGGWLAERERMGA